MAESVDLDNLIERLLEGFSSFEFNNSPLLYLLSIQSPFNDGFFTRNTDQIKKQPIVLFLLDFIEN